MTLEVDGLWVLSSLLVESGTLTGLVFVSVFDVSAEAECQIVSPVTLLTRTRLLASHIVTETCIL